MWHGLNPPKKVLLFSQRKNLKKESDYFVLIQRNSNHELSLTFFKCTKKMLPDGLTLKIVYRVAPEYALSDITSKSNLIKILDGLYIYTLCFNEKWRIINKNELLQSLIFTAF